MLYRILTVRRHKTVTFCDSYSFHHYRQQLVFYHDQIDCSQLTSGCTADLTCHPGKNKRGLDVLYVDAVHRVFPPMNSSSFKGFQKEDQPEKTDISTLAQDLNGGIHLRQYKFRLQFLKRLKSLLEEKHILETNTTITTPHRGTSIASPVQACGQYIGRRYIKITHELGLKMQSYLSLAPLYEIGFVMRDRYTTKSGLNEFLTLEAVIPCDTAFSLKDFYIEILKMSRDLARELDLQYDPLFDELKVIDAEELYSRRHTSFSKDTYLTDYEQIVRDHPHCIVCNAPMESPLGIGSEEKGGLVMETKWIMNGHGFGHGYFDEYRADKLRETFSEQQNVLLEKGIYADLPEDYLELCEYAGIPTFSFNLGIDRYLNCFFGGKLD